MLNDPSSWFQWKLNVLCYATRQGRRRRRMCSELSSRSFTHASFLLLRMGWDTGSISWWVERISANHFHHVAAIPTDNMTFFSPFAWHLSPFSFIKHTFVSCRFRNIIITQSHGSVQHYVSYMLSNNAQTLLGITISTLYLLIPQTAHKQQINCFCSFPFPQNWHSKIIFEYISISQTCIFQGCHILLLSMPWHAPALMMLSSTRASPLSHISLPWALTGQVLLCLSHQQSLMQGQCQTPAQEWATRAGCLQLPFFRKAQGPVFAVPRCMG